MLMKTMYKGLLRTQRSHNVYYPSVCRRVPSQISQYYQDKLSRLDCVAQSPVARFAADLLGALSIFAMLFIALWVGGAS